MQGQLRFMPTVIENRLKKIFLKIFPNLHDLDFKKNRDSFENWDSLNHLQLVSEIETTFGIILEMDEIAGIEKPADFVPLIIKKSKK